ncbi:hypothetical protein RHMOL_Rhmol13G0073600 [Rhododendron molle]|uniref:Uncharacterized protein n=1 Tax=Rhododendron molle TaxID=49168 RepID=A0ACC0L4Y3_RHOML|nr:hypothetical protein RHMOL_Rhmol13G0073600 [Rhododendron molle]
MAAAPNGCIRQDWPTLEIVNSKDRFSWRKPLLGVLFPSEVLPNILSIHVPKDRKRDELLWEHTSNGQYTVKSGFFSAYVSSLGALSISGGYFEGWRKLWSLKLPPKLALFFWRVLHRILPVKDGIEVAVRNVYDAFAQMKSLQGGLKKCSTSFLGADAWRKESWEGVVAWVLDGADDRGGTLKVYACSVFMVEAIAVLKALEWAWNRPGMEKC